MRIVQASSFRPLLGRLLEEVRACCEADPWGSKWILTPTALLAGQLRSCFAKTASGDTLSGIRVVPLPVFVSRLLATASQSPAPLWSSLLDLLLQQVVGRVGDASPLLNLQRDPEAFRILVPTFRDLGDAGFGIDQTWILEELAQEEESSPLIRDVLLLYCSWIRTLEASGVEWAPLQQLKLNDWIRSCGEREWARSLGQERDQTCSLYLFGFYDFTDVNLETVGALSYRTDVTLFIPAGSATLRTAVYEFAKETAEEILLRNPGASVEFVESATPSTQFVLTTFPEGVIPERPGFLTFQRASGVEAEVISAAARVLDWLDRIPGLAPEDILLAVPDVRQYYDSVRRVFAAFGIPVAVAELDLSEGGKARPFLILEKMRRDPAPLEWLLFYLREYPSIPVFRGLAINSLEQKLRQLHLVSTYSWKKLLQIASEEPHLLESARACFTEGEIDFLKQAVRLWFQNPETTPRMLSPGEARSELEEIAAWLPDPDLCKGLRNDLARLEELLPGAEIPRDSLLLLASRENAHDVRSDPQGLGQVLLAPLMKARGLTRRALVLMGMSADRFPVRVEEDPLLPDLLRSRLAARTRDLGHRLLVKSRIDREMTLLFALFQADSDLLHWVIPETDENGRAVAPCPYLLRYLNSWSQGDHREAFSRRIPRSPSQQSEHLLALDPLQGSFLPPRFAVGMAGFGGEGDEITELAERMRRRESDPAFHGIVQWGNQPIAFRKQSLSTTRLEHLAQCPFAFWAQKLAGIEPIEPTVWSGQPGARERGSVIHKILERIGNLCAQREASFGSIEPEALADPALEERLDVSPRLTLELMPPMFRRVTLAAIFQQVRGLFEAIQNGQCRDLRIQAPEAKLRLPFPGIPGLEITGELDMVATENNKAIIFDYKSGRSHHPKTPAEDPDHLLGFRLQPYLYPWLYSGNKPRAEVGDFRFIYLADSPPEVVAFELSHGMEEVSSLLTLLRHRLEAGAYLPYPLDFYGKFGLADTGKCAFCSLSSLCRRFEKGCADRSFRFAGSFDPDGFARIKAVAEK